MNLTTTYLGLPLSNPIVASASPLSRTADMIHRLEQSGWRRSSRRPSRY